MLLRKRACSDSGKRSNLSILCGVVFTPLFLCYNRVMKRRRYSKLRTFLKVILIIVLIIILAVGALVAFLSATEYKPSAIENLNVENRGTSSGETKELKLLTWNIGYGCLGENADFFMDGGKQVSTATKDQTHANMYAITKEIRKADPDVVFLQEVDRSSQRSHFINEKYFIENNTKNYCDTFATNYRCAFVPYPWPPIGKVDGGIQTLSKLQLNSAERVALPCPFTWPTRVANLKRCISINKASINGGSNNLSLVNLHLEAYDNGSGKKAQTKILKDYLDMEYESGNYVIAAGDFNQTFSDVDTSMYPQQADKWQCGQLDCSEFSSDWQFEMDTTHPTCRSLDQPYAGADKNNFQYYMIDGFIVSKNIRVKKVETLDLGFAHSDHNPVVLTVEIPSKKSGDAQTSAKKKPSVSKKVTISAVGDCALGKIEQHGYDGSFLSYYDRYGASYFFSNVKSIFDKSDFTIANLEGTFTDARSKVEKKFNIKGPTEYTSILLAGGIDAVGTGNNHIFDYGEQGAKDTWSALDKAKIPYAYNDRTMILKADNGLKVGVVAVNVLATSREHYIKEGIESLKQQKADVIIVMAHWGIEHTFDLTAYQKDLGHRMIDWGADLVLGCHTHCLQGLERYKGKVISYSGGNFCFGANLNPDDKDTMILTETFRFKNDKMLKKIDLDITPCKLSSTDSHNDFCPTPAMGSEATRIIKKLNDISAKEMTDGRKAIKLDDRGKYIWNK